MKKSLLVYFTPLLFIFNISAKAQYVLNEADKQYALYNYNKAIDLYEQAYKKKNTLYTAFRLANAYYLTKDYKQAESWYAVTVGIPGSTPEHILGYAKALINNSKYAEAKQQLLKYSNAPNVSLSQVAVLLQSCDSAMNWMKKPVPVLVQNERALNSKQSDWGAVKNKDAIVFASDRSQVIKGQNKLGRPFLKFDGNQAPDKAIYGWTGNSYLRLYQKTGNDDALEILAIDADTEYHIGAASFTADGNEMYFTLTRIPKKMTYNKNRIGTIYTEIYHSKRLEDGKTWGKPASMNFNKPDAYSVGDPYISKDGNSLYFVSDMPGGKGGMDIYVTIKSALGEWTAPLNLKDINTEGNERSPFQDDASAFFFSSDGYAGMGGLDIFKSERAGKGYGKPVNLGYPVNSPQDDFAFNLNSATTGYLSSNRTGGVGDDDIYSVTRQVLQALNLEGRVFNKKTGLPLESAIVGLKTQNGNTLKVQTDKIGYYSFKIDKDVPYDVNAEKTGFRDAGTNFITQVSLTKDFYLTPSEIDKPIKLENIYYDFNRSNIRPDAALELDKLVTILEDNPTIWIEIGSHTDSRGNDHYNLVLSQQRASAVVQYLISKGIAKNRLSAKGYGETELLNHCKNGINCTDAEHQLNRRTEFRILKL